MCTSQVAGRQAGTREYVPLLSGSLGIMMSGLMGSP